MNPDSDNSKEGLIPDNTGSRVDPEESGKGQAEEKGDNLEAGLNTEFSSDEDNGQNPFSSAQEPGDDHLQKASRKPENAENPHKEASPEKDLKPKEGASGSGGQPPEEPPRDSSSTEKKDEEDGEEGMGLLDHLSELRRCLVRACIWAIIGFGLCWAFVDPIFDLLLNPLLAVLPEGTHAQYTTLPEAFFTRVFVAFVAGLFLASPAIFYQVWAFVAPGLYDEEKRWILPIALLSAIFFVAGAVFCYFIVFPFAFAFFISYSTPDIVITPKVSDYLNFVIKLLFAFGLIFEMPIFTFFLARLSIISAAMMRKARRYAIVIIFIIAAILTPPDVVSQLLMAVPMLLLYEVSIGVAVIFGKRKETEKGEELQKEEKDVR